MKIGSSFVSYCLTTLDACDKSFVKTSRFRKTISVLKEIRMLSRLNLLSFPCILFLAVIPLYAQLGTGTISGTVFDQSGAVLPGASITATNTGTGFMRQTISSETGDYRLAGLVPGTYELAVEFSGFSRFVRSGFTLQVDQNARIDARLSVGSSTENVVVTAQA